MGWWRIEDESGQIAYALPSGHPGDDSVPRNAIPGRDDVEEQYNGDRPADAMGRVFKEINALYKEAWGRIASPDEMRACFNFVFNGWVRREHTPPATAERDSDG